MVEASNRVSDRLRIRGRKGRALSPARDKGFFKVGSGDTPFESADDDINRGVGVLFDAMSMTLFECVFCGRQEPYKAVYR